MWEPPSDGFFTPLTTKTAAPSAGVAPTPNHLERPVACYGSGGQEAPVTCGEDVLALIQEMLESYHKTMEDRLSHLPGVGKPMATEADNGFADSRFTPKIAVSDS